MTWRFFKQLVIASFHLDTIYRSGFWFSLAGRFIGIAIFFTTYKIIYRNVQYLAGLSEDKALLYFAIYLFIEQVLMTLVARGFNRLPRLVHYGELDRVLVRPVDSQAFVSLQLTSFLSAFNALPPLVLLAYVLIKNPQLFSWWIFPLMIIAIVGIYAIWFIFMTITFIASQFNELANVFTSIMSMLQFPAQIYQGIVAVILTFVIPIGSMILLPVNAAFEPGMGLKLSIWGLVITVILLITSRLAWRLGLRSYMSAS